MPFLGNTPSNTFVSIAKQTITGNGGTTYTLSYQVTSANDIDVFYNNVRQEPGVAYTATGTSITFSEAIQSTDSVYILFNGQAVSTISPSAGSVGSSTLTNDIEFSGNYIKLPVGTTAQRPSVPTVGMTRYNATTGKPEIYQAGQWNAYSTTYNVDYLVVAGGGAGGASSVNSSCGGGGAGGYLSGNLTILSGMPTYVVIGAGGSPVTNSLGNNGSNSTLTGFTTLTAIGGGGGGGGTYSTITAKGGNGGSGGGTLQNNQGYTGGLGTAGQGNNGGLGSSSSPSWGGGGGGGAGAAGSNGTPTNAGPGGVGAQWVNGSYYAGGGGGATYNGYTGGAGGTGGGGAGGSTSAATAGTVNTGGGGGASSYPGDTYGAGGSGGSGVVIIRYAGTPKASGGTITQSGGYTYHTFTTSDTFIS